VLRVPLDRVAVPSADAFATPLGQVPVDRQGRDGVVVHPAVRIDDWPHAAEHSLEVQLPFLQLVLDRFEVLPLVVGYCRPEVVADVLDVVHGNDASG